jgi:hypothetical protein
MLRVASLTLAVASVGCDDPEPTANPAPPRAAAPSDTAASAGPPSSTTREATPLRTRPLAEPRPADAGDLEDAEPGAELPLQFRTDAGSAPAARAQRVLHVGDSMVPLVGNYLRPIFQADGRKYFIESVTSSSTLSWDNQRLLQSAMFKYDPQVILISLGSNELFDRDPKRRIPAIKRLVADTRGRPCLWIGPPAWKEDFGFIQVLKANLGHCRYLDSVALKLPRMADGRHPSWTGGYRWASAVYQVLGGTDQVPTGNVKPK